jgi:hypothetical protein
MAPAVTYAAMLLFSVFGRVGVQGAPRLAPTAGPLPSLAAPFVESSANLRDEYGLTLAAVLQGESPLVPKSGRGINCQPMDTSRDAIFGVEVNLRVCGSPPDGLLL